MNAAPSDRLTRRARPGSRPKVYEFFIDDERYRVVPRLVEEAQNVESAETRAREILEMSMHRRKVMVYRRGAYLFAVTRSNHPKQQDT